MLFMSNIDFRMILLLNIWFNNVPQLKPSGTLKSNIQPGREWIGPQTPCGLTWTPSSSASKHEAFLLQLSTSTTMCLAMPCLADTNFASTDVCKIVV